MPLKSWRKGKHKSYTYVYFFCYTRKKKTKAQTGLKQNVPWVDEAPKASIHLWTNQSISMKVVKEVCITIWKVDSNIFHLKFKVKYMSFSITLQWHTLYRVVLFYVTQSDNSWSNNARFMHKLCLSLYAMNRLGWGK